MNKRELLNVNIYSLHVLHGCRVDYLYYQVLHVVLQDRQDLLTSDALVRCPSIAVYIRPRLKNRCFDS